MVDDLIDKTSPPTNSVEPAETVEVTPSVADRRRPGRVEYLNPALISLLRKPTADPSRDEAHFADDPLAPARGVMFAVPAGALVWCALALGVWYFLR